MTIKDVSIEEVTRSIREMTDSAIQAAQLLDASIAGVNKAVQSAHQASNHAVAQAEEAGSSVRMIAEEARRISEEAINSAKREAEKTTEAARQACNVAVKEAEDYGRSVRTRADEAMKTAAETVSKAMNEASKALAVSEDMTNRMVNRIEQFSNMTRQMAEESFNAARDAAQVAIDQANAAAGATQEALRQSASRAGAISDLARIMAEQTARTATEASQFAKKSIEEGIARSTDWTEAVERSRQRQEQSDKQINKLLSKDTGYISSPILEEKAVAVPECVLTEVPDNVNVPLQDSQPRKSLRLFGNLLRLSRETESETDKSIPAAPAEDRLSEAAQRGTALDKAEETGAGYAELERLCSETLETDQSATPGKNGKFRLYSGSVRVMVYGGDTFKIENLGRHLNKIDNVTVVLRGSSRGNPVFVLMVDKELPMVQILANLPLVEDAIEAGSDIRINLKC